MPLSPELELDHTLEVKLAFLNSNSAISFARECLRLDPRKRPNCVELMAHDYFNDFREWFEDEIQSLIEIDNQEAQQVISGLSWRSKALPSQITQPLMSHGTHSLSRQSLGNQLSVDYEEAKISARPKPEDHIMAIESNYQLNDCFQNAGSPIVYGKLFAEQ